MEAFKYSLAELQQEEAILFEKLLSEGKVTNFEKGYLSLSWVNQLIDTRLQRYAARNLAYKLIKQNPSINKVIGIPTLGAPLASMVAEELGLELALGRKGNDVPGAWRQTIVINEETPSFTTGRKNSFVFNGLSSGDNVAIVDDFLAYGDTSIAIVNKFTEYNITSLVAVYCAKLFQPGVSKLRQMNVDPVFVYGIENIFPDGRIMLISSNLK